MQKPTKQKPRYKGIEFDSKEEIEFFQWCEEAQKYGFISGFQYHPETIEICPRQSRHYRQQKKTKTVIKEEFMLNPLTYTADFIIRPTHKMNRFKHDLKTLTNEYWIDTKGTNKSFPTKKKDRYGKEKIIYVNNEDTFKFVQRAAAFYLGIYVNKVVLQTKDNKVGFFDKTWVPEKARFTTAQRKVKSCYRFCSTVHQVLDLPELYPPRDYCSAPNEQTDLFSNDNPVIDDRGWA